MIRSLAAGSTLKDNSFIYGLEIIADVECKVVFQSNRLNYSHSCQMEIIYPVQYLYKLHRCSRPASAEVKLKVGVFDIWRGIRFAIFVND